jgi:hypothetical protein
MSMPRCISSSMTSLAAIVLSIALFAAVSSRAAPEELPQPSEAGDRQYFQSHGYENLGISRQDLPRRGHCRIWHPERPAVEQPAAGKCSVVSRHARPGAWLMARSIADPGHVSVHVFDERSPGVVKTIGIFSVDTRQFVRYVSP